ncbi:hypothetical protein M8J76_015148 [Diaphorina citri]|nr:hypothetical protein M8J75_000939 [Diaphorina citri]KAI5750369.1 hypothetical protein M8J76_015148 [Diaphorina citri]KAI5754070.1 hypothetical protein M8J77_005481 [Diaphorina citri]
MVDANHVANGFHQEFYKNPNVLDLKTNKPYASKHRHILNNIEEFWFYVQSEVRKLKKSNAVDVDKILDLTSQFKRSLMTDMEELGTLAGGDTLAERQNRRLGELVQARLRHIQNPRDCKTARKVSCQINWACGFGCQLHHVTYCLIIAYATNRTLVLDSTGWNYHSGGWEEMFEPLSQTCRTATEGSVIYWPDHKPDKQIIKLASQTYSLSGPGFIPRAVPQDIAQELIHGEPIVWWVGQIVKYIFKPNAKVRAMLSHHAQQIGFSHPVVGVHIRRTDKGSEAAPHPIHEYMRHVEEYYAQLSLQVNVTERKVYVATDEKGVIMEIRQKYPAYTILGDASTVEAASSDRRYSTAGLLGIITDLYFLSHSDYLVCTFSSQICRIAYELLNTDHRDASLNFKSLDDIWFFAGQRDNIQLAVLDHTPQTADQIELRVGDEVKPAGNHWDGFSRGTNLRTNRHGLYPSFKVISRVETYKFPTYPEVKLPQR